MSKPVLTLYCAHPREYCFMRIDTCISSSQSSRDREYPILERQPSYYNPLHSFDLAKGDQKHYQQQYGDMYFLRLAKLKPVVEQIAAEAWDGFQVHNVSEVAPLVHYL